eukprot:CAMPEP_0119129332 /NCGR_PEP_ID=MMETSP1310-20130426/7128_1 /TAXON_ID=464262 /ORGANISM="Genus nov. species nov., Strain RCC2339" /LENGTH=488 /DNA_ID=CAMNT_0007119751 /DNA_START=203 /DNA_END=1666 /DNA_ORIENTATION=+
MKERRKRKAGRKAYGAGNPSGERHAKRKRVVGDATHCCGPHSCRDVKGQEVGGITPSLHIIQCESSAAPLSVKALEAAYLDASTEGRDTRDICGEAFAALIYPMSVERFREEFWEKKALVIHRPHLRDYYSDLYSTERIGRCLDEAKLCYTRDIDVTLYKEGKRFTLNGKSHNTAQASRVWELYKKDRCSVRVLHPQRFENSLASYMAMLEELWGSGAGSNAYLTPAGSQGFAPHFDDVDAYVVQLEGKKRWNLYGHRCTSEILPRYSSPNFEQNEVEDFLLYQLLLQPGDLCYFPRGVIHQAKTEADAHSLHLTISTGCKHTWYDLLSLGVPMALDLAEREVVAMRRSMDWDIWRRLGIARPDGEGTDRVRICGTILQLLNLLPDEFPVDAVADAFVQRHTMARLPPPLRTIGTTCDADAEEESPTEVSPAEVSPAEVSPTEESPDWSGAIRMVCSDAFRVHYEVNSATGSEECVVYSHMRNEYKHH